MKYKHTINKRGSESTLNKLLFKVDSDPRFIP